MKSIEFDFDTQDGRTVLIYGEVDNGKITFSAELNGKKVSKSSFNSRDVNLIYDLIDSETADFSDDFDNLMWESDFYDRQSD